MYGDYILQQWKGIMLHLDVLYYNQNKKGVLFKFLVDSKLRRARVQRTRDKCKGPSEHSALCSEHFSEECFEPTSVISKKIGLKMKQMIKPDAILTIFSRPAPTTSTKLKQLCRSVA